MPLQHYVFNYFVVLSLTYSTAFLKDDFFYKSIWAVTAVKNGFHRVRNYHILATLFKYSALVVVFLISKIERHFLKNVGIELKPLKAVQIVRMYTKLSIKNVIPRGNCTLSISNITTEKCTMVATKFVLEISWKRNLSKSFTKFRC